MTGIKTFTFLLLLTGIMIAVGAGFDYFFNGNGQVMRMFAVLTIFMNIGAYWFSDTVILKMHGAREVTPEEAPRVHEIVNRLVKQAGMPMPKVCIVQSHVPNAFATGRNPKHSAVAVTDGLLQTLNSDEIEGVIAHELAHIKHRDTLLQTVVACVVGVISLMASHARWGLLLGGGRRGDREGGSPLAIVAILVVAVLGPIFALIVRGMISQQREYAADAGGAAISGSPISLASALRTIDKQAKKIMAGRGAEDALGVPATEHLYFINHFALGEKVSRLFSSHPPTEERIKRLLEMAERGGAR